MARFIPDGKLKIRFVAAIASDAAPTITEINAGTDATPFLRALNTPLEGSIVDISDVSSKFNKTAPGTYGGQPVTAEFYRDDVFASDTIWTLLARGVATHIVICRRGGSGTSGAIAATDKVDVWPVTVVTRNPAAYARNEPTGFTVEFAVPEEPTEDATVAS
jgi:hypothetical protein